MTTVDWFYSVAFKKPRSGRLVWRHPRTKDPTEASRFARAEMERNFSGRGYQEYGQSRSYVRCWRGPGVGENWDEFITRDEYVAELRLPLR